MISSIGRVSWGARLWGLVLMAVAIAGCSTNSAPPTSQKAAFWPSYPDEPRLQFLVSYSMSSDVEPPKSKLDELIYGREPHPVLPINKPYGVAMWDGRIYVCDQRGASVTVLDLRNHRTLQIGKTDDGLMSPTAIAIASDGTKYVADMGRNLVYVYDQQDRLAGKIGHKAFKPVGVAVYQDELYVCDYENKRVEVFNRRTGQSLRMIGGPGGEPGQFIWPLGIAIDQQGFLYVSDVMKDQIQKFDRDGKLVTNLSGTSARVGGLVRPKHIAVDREGTIYVVDAAFENVQLFDQLGRVYTFFGGAGGFPGAMYMPAGICVHEGDMDLFQSYVHPAFQADRLVLVTNQFGDNKVSVYAMGRLKPGKTLADIASSRDVVKIGVGDNNGPLTSRPAGSEDNFDEPGASTQPAATTRPVGN